MFVNPNPIIIIFDLKDDYIPGKSTFFEQTLHSYPFAVE